MNDYKAIILGCGSSSAVPGIGNYWGNCNPSEPKNRRSRCSAAILKGNSCLIIDTGPDFKAQFDRFDLPVPAAILYTHGHADHINGADELRWLAVQSKKPFDIYGSRETIDEIKARFYYLFEPARPDLYPKVLEATIWNQSDFSQVQKVSDFTFDIFTMDHESVTSTGFRFGDFAYCTDLIRLDDAALEKLKGIKNWVVDAGAYKNPHNKAHACIDQVYRWNEVVGAENVYFTAMAPNMDYETVLNETPDGFGPAWDGLTIPVTE